MQIDRPGFMNVNTSSAMQGSSQINSTGQEVPKFTLPGEEQKQQCSIPMMNKNMTPEQHMKDLELMKQCKEFESVLISQMFKQMRPKADKEDLFGSTKDREMFNSMIDDERAKVWAQKGGIGLASVMFQQMKDTGK